nr:MAG TPA: hypothetical protein [Caudoviricetes sp.]
MKRRFSAIKRSSTWIWVVSKSLLSTYAFPETPQNVQLQPRKTRSSRKNGRESDGFGDFRRALADSHRQEDGVGHEAGEGRFEHSRHDASHLPHLGVVVQVRGAVHGDVHVPGEDDWLAVAAHVVAHDNALQQPELRSLLQGRGEHQLVGVGNLAHDSQIGLHALFQAFVRISQDLVQNGVEVSAHLGSFRLAVSCCYGRIAPTMPLASSAALRMALFSSRYCRPLSVTSRACQSISTVSRRWPTYLRTMTPLISPSACSIAMILSRCAASMSKTSGANMPGSVSSSCSAAWMRFSTLYTVRSSLDGVSFPMVILLSLVGVPKGYGARHRKRKTPPKRGSVTFSGYMISPSCVSRTDFATAFITSKLALPTFSASLAFTLLQTVSDSTESRKSFPSQVSDFMKHDAGAGWSSGFT